jgi:hypothetical protein
MPTLARTIVVGTMAMALAASHAALAIGQTKPAVNGNGVAVTVKYAGKGTVDATHKIWVWLFDTPDIDAGAIPIAEQAIEKNGGTASFADVTAKQVYIAIAYDEQGGFLGQAPPPPGSPVMLYGAKTPKDLPQPVTPGAKATVTATLTDAQRMQ